MSRAASVPRLHVVTDSRVLSREGWSSEALSLMEAGGGDLALHVRGPRLEGRALYQHVRGLVDGARRTRTALVVNDRVDIALVMPVWGVQLRESSLPVSAVKRLVGRKVHIGASVHDGRRALQAEREGADYLVVGAVFSTASHPDRRGRGPDLLREMAAASGLPLIAIGGLTPERVETVLDAGAHGVAVLGGIWDAPEPAAAVAAYLEALG